MIEVKPRGYFGGGVTQKQADLLNAAMAQLAEAGIEYEEMPSNSGYERYILTDDQLLDKLKSKYPTYYCDTAIANRGHWYLIQLGPKTTLEVSQKRGVEGCHYISSKYLFSADLFTNQSVKQRQNYYSECAVFNKI
ncbi:hypothetical protein D3C80_1386390 [compost metagenome]